MAWLSGWTFRKPVPIAGGSEAAADYPVPLTVHYGAGTDAPGHVYLGSKGQSDFADLRFCAADGETALSYWIESKTDGDQALVWVRVDAVPTTGASIFVYYGNADAGSASDGDATFLWFSHFDADESARFTGATSKASYADSVLTFRGTSSTWDAIWSIDAFPPGSCIRTRMKRDIAYTQFGLGAAGANEDRVAEYPGTTKTKIQKAINGSFTNSPEVTRTYDYQNTFNLHELKWLNGRLIMEVNGATIIDWSTTTPTRNMTLLIQAFREVTYFDWLAVRPIIATEPAVGIAGSEEAAGDAPPSISASFTAAPLDPPVPLTVQFTDTSAAFNTSIESWLWEFGDGTTSSEQHPLHTYAARRWYDVTLTITAEGGELVSVAAAQVLPDDLLDQVVGQMIVAPVDGNAWSDLPAWVRELTDVVAMPPLTASDGPVIERGGLGRPVGVLIAVPAADENYWDRPRQADHPASALSGGLYADPDGNWWNRQLFRDEASSYDGTKLGGRINWISADREMLGVSVPGRFIKLFDGGAVVGESYPLTQHKPWQAHVDNIDLSAETYALTIIAGWGSTPPRHVSAVRYAEGVLLEWDPPADKGSSGRIDEYRIYRGPDLGSVTLVATVAGTERHYLDADAPSPAVYIVAAFNRIIESDPSQALDIVDPDRAVMRDALAGAAWGGLPYAGWMGVRAIRLRPAVLHVLMSGRTLQVEALIYPVDASVLDLAWSSDRPDRVSVDQGGIVTAHAPGRAVITAASTDGSGIIAQVPIVSMPRMMVDDIGDRLTADGFTGIYKRFAPDLDECIVLRQMSGEAPEAALDIDRPALAVAVRATDLGRARETMRAVHDALHMATPLTLNGTHYYSVEALSAGQYEEKGRRGPRYVCTATFRMEKERRLEGAP